MGRWHSQASTSSLVAPCSRISDLKESSWWRAWAGRRGRGGRKRRTHLVSVLRYGDVAGLGGLDRRVEHVVGVEAQEDGVQHVGVDEGLERSRSRSRSRSRNKAKYEKGEGEGIN